MRTFGLQALQACPATAAGVATALEIGDGGPCVVMSDGKLLHRIVFKVGPSRVPCRAPSNEMKLN